MIIGIGTDLVDMRRIEKAWQRWGDVFVHRILTPFECTEIDGHKDHIVISYLSKAFAAKEACSKAIGTGFRQGVSWQDFELRRNALRQPQMHLSGAAFDHLQKKMVGDMMPNIHMSLCDEWPYAQAFVVIG